jgi:hypothetical protein
MRSEKYERMNWSELNGIRCCNKKWKKAFQTCNEALLFLMKVACSVDTLLIPFTRFHELYKFLVSVKTCITLTLYHDIKSYSNLILYIISLIQNSLVI